MQKKSILTLFLLLLFVSLSAQKGKVLDGPYLSYKNDTLVARWVWPTAQRTGQIVWQQDSLSKLPDFRTFRPEYINPLAAFPLREQLTFEGVDSVAVMSDIHGQFEAARKLLINANVMDEDHHWTYGSGHLVIVGDIFDRGPAVTETLWLIYNLQKDALKAKGRVHFLLGNHETMALSGNNTRYINKWYLESARLLGTTYYDLYDKNSYLGRWLRSLPVTIRINDNVFVHGGFSKELLNKVTSLRRINQLYHLYLVDKPTSPTLRLPTETTERLNLLQGSSGPLWYRGYFLDRDFNETDIDRILRKLKARRMIVGHTSFKAIQMYFNGKVIGVDSSIKFGSTGEILLMENGEIKRADLYGKQYELLAAANKRK